MPKKGRKWVHHGSPPRRSRENTSRHIKVSHSIDVSQVQRCHWTPTQSVLLGTSGHLLCHFVVEGFLQPGAVRSTAGLGWCVGMWASIHFLVSLLQCPWHVKHVAAEQKHYPWVEEDGEQWTHKLPTSEEKYQAKTITETQSQEGLPLSQRYKIIVGKASCTLHTTKDGA